MTHCLFSIINLVPIDDSCICGIQNGGRKTFLFSGIDIERCCLISLTVEFIKMFLLHLLVNLYVLLGVSIAPIL